MGYLCGQLREADCALFGGVFINQVGQVHLLVTLLHG